MTRALRTVVLAQDHLVEATFASFEESLSTA